MAVMTEQSADDTTIRPFTIEFSDSDLEDLRARIAATRWPEREGVEDASQGVQLAVMEALARYWETEHDWRKCEAKLNALPQFTTEIDGVEIHFIHVRSRHENALPLIMTHGWPGSVIELLDTVGPLTDPTRHGGSPGDAFGEVDPFHLVGVLVGGGDDLLRQRWTELLTAQPDSGRVTKLGGHVGRGLHAVHGHDGGGGEHVGLGETDGEVEV